MLSPGTEKCPRCGKRIRAKGASDGYSGRDIAHISLYVLGIALIPIAIILLVSILCLQLAD